MSNFRASGDEIWGQRVIATQVDEEDLDVDVPASATAGVPIAISSKLLDPSARDHARSKQRKRGFGPYPGLFTFVSSKRLLHVYIITVH